MKGMRERIVIAHILFLIASLFVLVDFWQTRPKADQVTDVQRKIVYHTGSSNSQSPAFNLYQVRTQHHIFTIPEEHVPALRKSSAITIHCTPFLQIIRHIEANNQSIPISMGVHAAISFAIVALAIAALTSSKHPDFRSFAAIINALLGLMVIYMIWC